MRLELQDCERDILVERNEKGKGMVIANGVDCAKLGGLSKMKVVPKRYQSKPQNRGVKNIKHTQNPNSKGTKEKKNNIQKD